MSNKNESTQNEERRVLLKDIETIKLLLVILVHKLGVSKNEIAKTMGISPGRLSQILDPKKYK
jgi:predicted transcriptional regulator